MIDGNIYIEDLVNDYPEVVSPLAKMGIVCIACGEPVWGTLNELINSKGLDNSEEIIEELNKIIKEINSAEQLV
jgi:methionine synthase II (cobalamin-independent)